MTRFTTKETILLNEYGDSTKQALLASIIRLSYQTCLNLQFDLLFQSNQIGGGGERQPTEKL